MSDLVLEQVLFGIVGALTGTVWIMTVNQINDLKQQVSELNSVIAKLRESVAFLHARLVKSDDRANAD